MKLKIVFCLVLFLMSFSVFADVYPVIISYTVPYTGAIYHPTKQQACDAYAAYVQPSWPTSTVYGVVDNTTCLLYRGAGVLIGSQVIVSDLTCPGGGTLSGNQCINAPECISPQLRDPQTGICGAPSCTPPEFLDEVTQTCQIPECPTGQVPNETTGSCQTPPVCSVYEHYVNSSNSCVLNELNCPEHSHANNENDGCLPDPPLVCPTGQHDDGTYHCIADDAKKCKANEQSGYINNVLQCIPRTNKHEQNLAAANTDKQTAETANQNSINDPTNQGLANIANAASNNGLLEQGSAGNELLNSIDQTTNEMNNREKMKQATPGGDNCDAPPACSGDPIQCAILAQQHKSSCFGTTPTQRDVNNALGGTSTLTETTTSLLALDDAGLGLSSTCPVPKQYTVLNATMSIDYTPFCDIANIISYIVMIGASFISLKILAA